VLVFRLIQLNMRVGSAKTVKRGIPELKSAGLITDTASGEPTLTDKGYKTQFDPGCFVPVVREYKSQSMMRRVVLVQTDWPLAFTCYPG
jgi:hypothetical protein